MRNSSINICVNRCNELKQKDGTTNYSSRKMLENPWHNSVQQVFSCYSSIKLAGQTSVTRWGSRTLNSMLSGDRCCLFL